MLERQVAAFVHRDNPVGMLTLEQLARAYIAKATRWGDLGDPGGCDSGEVERR